MLNSKRLLLAITGLILITIFVMFSPSIDQYFASMAYDPSTRVFYGERASWCRVIYYLVPVITVGIILLPIAYFLKSRKNPSAKKNVINFALVVYLALSIGPGIVVNVIFKEHWGRPRPYQVLRDGKSYSPFWQPHFNNKKDNSFPGGHASMGFFMGIPFFALNRRKQAVVVSLLGGTIVGLVRILQGGHYFSDVVFSGIFVWGISLIVVSCISKNKRKLGCE